MKKLLSLLLTVVAIFALSSCGLSNGGAKTVATVVKEENTVVITVEELEGACTLLALMEELQEEGKLTFTVDLTGMVQSMEGKANPADWSACWMLYTSDKELSNTEWGTIEYESTMYASAIVGAESLTVSVGEYYIWAYVSF